MSFAEWSNNRKKQKEEGASQTVAYEAAPSGNSDTGYSFSQWSNNRKKQREESASQTVAYEATPLRNSDTSCSFSQWSNNKKSEEAEKSAVGWLNASQNLLTEVQNYYQHWSNDDTQYRSFQDRASNLLSGADSWRKEYAGNDEAIKVIDSAVCSLSNLKKYAMKCQDYYSDWATEEDYNEQQKLLGEDVSVLDQEIANLEEEYETVGYTLDWTNYSQRQKIYDLEKTISQKKKYRKQVLAAQTEAAKEDERFAWQLKYSSKTYAELRKVIAGLADGEEKSWLLNYAEAKKTKDDWEKELSYSKAELTYLRQLQSERDRLIEFQGMATATPEYYDLKKRWEIYHNQFDNLDERIDALEKNIWSLERDVKYKFLNQNEDYAELSTPQDHASMVYRMVNDPSLTKKMDVGTDIGQKSKNGFIEAVAGVVDDFTFDNLQHMTNDERSTFNYIYEKEGKSAAKEYLEYLESALNERSMDQRLKTVSDLTQSVPVFSQTAASLLSVPLKLKGGVSGMIDATGQKIRNDITGENKPIDYNTDAMFFSKAASTIRGTVARNIVDATGYIDLDEEDHPVLSRLLNGKSLADVYQLGMSMVDSAAVAGMALINPVLGKAGTVMLGGAAGTQTMLDAVERGASDEQALAMGILSGFFEMFFEKYSLETLLNSNGRRFIDKVWRQAVAEGSEEFFTSAANNVADMIVMAEKSGYMKNVADYVASGMSESKAMQQALIDMGVEMGWDLVGGMFTGGLMGGGSKVASASVQQLQNYKTGKNILSTDGGVDALLYSADQVRGVSPIQTQNALANQIDKVSQKPTARNVGQLNATVQTTNNQANAAVNQEDVEKRLLEKGYYSKETAGVAEVVAARLNGQELTQTQRNTLRSAQDSPSVQSVISDMQKTRANQTNNVDPNLTARNIEQADATVQAASNPTSNSINPSEVAESLKGKGIPSQKIDTLAKAIVARVNGQDLTRSQRNVLRSELDRSVVQSIINDLIQKKSNGIDNVQDNGYDSTVGNGNRYEAVISDAAPQQVQKAVLAETYEGDVNASFTWKLRGRDVTLTDVKVQEISYVKRNSTELKSLRSEFNKTTRRAFIKDLGNNAEYLRNAGFSENDIIKIQNGRVPDGWQVHHKLPLDDSGTNSFDNLVLIQNEPYHKAITNYQNSIARKMKTGVVQTVEWPILDGSIYPAQH